MDGEGDLTKGGKGLNVAHLNVRSLLGGHKFEMVRNQIESSNIDVFTISESWLTKAIPDRVVECMNYCTVRLDRKWNEKEDTEAPSKRGGGVMAYIKKGIKFSDTKYDKLNVSCKDVEMMWVALEILNLRPIVVVIIYRPPQGNHKKCNSIINEAFERANLKDNTDVFMLGDFNVDFKDKLSVKTRELDFTMRSLSLNQLVKENTRTSNRNGKMVGTCIDLIFSNSEHITCSRTLDYNISDHLAVLVTRKKRVGEIGKVEFMGRSYRRYIKEDFQNNLSDSDWAPFYAMNDPDLMWEYMEGIVIKQANNMCPMKGCRVKAQREPWITNEAIEAIRDKDRLMGRAKRSGKPEDWENARRARNQVGRDLENLRADFLKRQQKNNKGDPKKFWKNISTIVPGKKGETGTIWLKDGGTNGEGDSEYAAEYINQFFTNIGPNLAKKHTKKWEYYGDIINGDMNSFNTDLEEVIALCKEINIMKSSGIDELSSRSCKDAFMVLGQQLVHMFNCSLNLGKFPAKWKIAKIIPLFKGGDRESVNNYRPVSLLPLPGKLLEKIVHKRIVSFWDENNFLSANQGGFRKDHSTISSIADLTDDLFHNINEGLTTVAAFVDLRKAFDTVNTNILANKLQNAGIRGTVLAWCINYLSGRQQCTWANGRKSSMLPVLCGVQQGSVLGPLFFLVYVNDMQQAVGKCGIKLYADDTVLYQSRVNGTKASGKLQESVNKFVNWCDANALTINAAKTKLMVFASRSKVKRCKNIAVKIGTDKLKLVPYFNYLGITLDSTLNFSKHITTVVQLICHKMSLLAKLKRYLRDETAILIYKTMLLPYFDYADVIFCKANKKDTDKLQSLQNKCLRICMGKERRFDTNRAHKLTSSPFLVDRREAHVCNFMFKRKNNPNLLNRRELRTRAHDAPLFNVQVPRCEAHKRSVAFHGSSTWNNLKVDARNINDYKLFKYKQKQAMTLPLKLIQ